ncbi:hypothetical protein LUZ60_005946 [Juncus effusus]|nr:hypothetical protein LUZ60_005946 [Juncus effusus]
MAASISKSLKLHQLRLGASATCFSAFSAAADAPLPPSQPPPPPPAAFQSQSQEKERGLISKLLLFLPGAITFGLGTWQLIRRQEKIEMLDYRRKRLETDPVTCKELPFLSSEIPSLEFRKLVCEGDFEEEKSVFVGPRSRSISGVTENGYYVITPLIPREAGVQTPILVNRGWVPQSWRDKHIKGENNSKEISKSEQDKDKDKDEKTASWWNFRSMKKPSSPKVKENKPPVRITGVIRSSENPSIFVPQNDPKSHQWFFVSVPQIARECSLPENCIYVEAIEEDGNDAGGARNPYPVPKDADSLIKHSVTPQDHLNYTFTWYTLSAAVTFMAAKRIKAKKVRL